VQEVLSLPWAQTLSTESTFVEQVMQQVSADLMLDMKEPPVELGGLKIRRLRLALVDTDGTEYPRPGGPTALTDLEEVQRKLTHDPSTLRSAYVGDTRLLQILPAKVYILSDEGASTTIQTALASLYLHPYSEIVRVVGLPSLSLATFIPSLAESDWNMIRLIDPKLGYVDRTIRGIRGLQTSKRGCTLKLK